MAIIKKYAEVLPTPLTNYNTFVVDTNPNSTYFKITEFNDTFTGGKNGFLIEGSEHLKETTEIKIQILDVNGDPIYYEPGNGIPEYYEGISKVIAVYVYEDTPIGEAKITILGELKTYLDENGNTQQIPEQWKGVYNLKWEKSFKVNKLLSNEDKVRFYKRPNVSITEIVKPIFNNIVTPVVQKGFAVGRSQTPSAGQPLANYTLPTSYLITTTDNSAWTGSVVGTYLEFTDLGTSLLVDDIVDNNNLTVSTPFTINGLVADFTSSRYTASFNYVEGVDNLKTALTGSFAKINITDLTTFVGDVARVKIFRKSQSDLSDYQFVQEIQLESNEVLVDLESQTKNQEFYGVFDQNNFKNYWVTSSNSLTTTFNQNYLFNSVKLDGTAISTYYHTSKSFDLTEGAEYTLGLSYRGDSTTTAGGALSQLRVFISGSRASTYGGVTTYTPVEQDIVTYKGNTSSILQKQIATVNFQAENFINPKLYFDVKGTGWHISDVSLRASQETSFSPDEITFIQPIPRTLPAETFDFLFQFYDINNNYIPVIVTETKTFDGGNLNVINKSIELIPSSLYFQFDSGSGNGNPVPPTVINVEIKKNYLTGSYTFTSRSFDFFGTELSSSMYSQLITPGWGGGQFPGYLNDNDGSKTNVFLTVQNFTGSRDPSLEEIVVQFIQYTVECEGVEDSMVITRVIDGKGGVNYEIRPYNGTVIRNSHPSSSLEVQAIRIDGVNEVNLQRGLPAGKSNAVLHVQSGSTYITLLEASQSQFVRGIRPGVTGSGQVEYNAVFNRDSINGQLTLYIIPTGSNSPSESILTTLTLTDIQDGLDAGVILYDADTFTINPRTQTKFTPIYSSATASFYKRGTFEAPISASFEIYPSMSINKDWVPEYWMQFTTWSCNENVRITAFDESGSVIHSRLDASNFKYGSPLSQSKQLLISVTYTEPWTSASVSVDKLFQIVPEGKPGDETIIFEVVPSTVALGANSRGVVGDYKPTTAEIRLKQGARYLAFTGSVATSPFASHGTFHVATSSIRGINITPGNIQFTSSNGVDYTASLIISASSNLTQLSGSIEIPLQIHPYFTSSIYTQSVFLNYTKVLEGAPPIQVIITPAAPNLKADEVGYISDYTAANTSIQVKDGDDFLRFTTQSTQPGTFRIQNGGSVLTSNIRTGSISSSSLNTATLTFQRFDYPWISASAQYNIVVYPYALGPGHEYTSSVIQRTQTFTKNVAPANARTVNLKASFDTVNFDKDGVVTSPLDPIILTATATNTTGAVWFQFYKDDIDYTGIVPEDAPGVKYATTEIGGGDATGPGENATWTVRIRDGNSSLTAPIRAENSLTIAGIKGGADAYKLVSSNDNCSITADLWTTSFTGTGMKITTFKGTEQLDNVQYYNYSTRVDDYLGNFIGYLGYSSASIFSKSPWITMASNKFPSSNPAEIGNITGWTSPATNKSGQIVYKVEFEGESSGSYLTRQTQFVTQSISVQFEPPAPYDIKLTNENSSAVYKTSGQFTTTGTGTAIRVYRGGTELVNTNPMPATDTDAYGTTGLSKDKCRVSVYSKSSHLTLGGGLIVGSWVTGTPATMAAVSSWTDPVNNPVAEIVYQVDCEGRQTFYKTQSLSVQYEGSTGPGIVMRGEWNSATDYSGSVETRNYRRDAVIYGTSPTTYYAAVSGSGPTTYNKQGTLVGAQAPTAGTDNAYWQYLGEEEFFVAAKIAIFEESFVKNTINVGNNSGSAYANIVLAGGRNDPYMAIGQYSTIGYGNTGIWLGIYNDGTGPTQYKPRFSMVNGTNDRWLKWTGTGLDIKGDITVTGGDAATQTYAQTVANSAAATAESNANGYTGTAIQLFSGSLGALAAIDQINSGSATTYIGPGSIVTSLVATNLITSTNYSASVEAQPYSDTGTFINLADGSIKAPGFAIQSNGNASFRGFLSSSNAIFGGWVLDSKALQSSNGRIKLDASAESITVLDTSNNPRFIANTDANLPSLTANAPSPTTGTGTGFNFDIQSINNVGDVYDNNLYNLLSFTAATGGGSHLITYTYNPASVYSSYVYANGLAYATLGITLVVTDSSDANIQYGTGRYFYAYGDFVDTCGGGGGGYFPIPSVIGSTEIILKDGSIKLAKDIVKGEEILSWDDINKKFTTGKITDIRSRNVDLVYKVVVGGEEVKVSDSHKFWADGDVEIPVTELIQGVSKIYVKVGNIIELKVVDVCEVVYENDDVFTFSVRDYHNYISNNVVSHNSAPYCYQFSSETQYVSKPMTLSITTGDLTSGGSYKVQLLISRTVASSDTTGYTTYDDSEGRAVFVEPSGAITLKRISAGTIANGGGFQSATSETQYLRHDKNSTTGYNTEVKGGLAVDKIYGFYDTLNNASPTPATFTSIGYDVPGYAMIKGYGRWASNVSQTGTVTIPFPSSMGGCITSLTQAAQGSYNINYTLTKADNTASTIYPSIFFTGVRDSSSGVECTFNFGKYTGDSTYTNFRTQDNNTDGLQNMDELGILIVM